jgi:hypothetical protein
VGRASVEKATVASMKADLRNLVTAEEAYFTDSLKYTTATSCANPPAGGAAAYYTSAANALGAITIGTGTQAGWTVNMTNLNTPKSCSIYVGSGITPAAPAVPGSPEGSPVCL